MRNEQFYKIVIVLLLVLNGGVLGYLWMNNNKPHDRPPHGPHMGPDQVIIDRIGLDEKQQQTFQGLKEEHHEMMVGIQSEDAKLHGELFRMLKQASIDSIAKGNILAQLKTNDSLKEEATFDHFRKLRAILTPEQQPKLDELMAELAGRIMSDHRRPPPPPGH